MRLRGFFQARQIIDYLRQMTNKVINYLRQRINKVIDPPCRMISKVIAYLLQIFKRKILVIIRSELGLPDALFVFVSADLRQIDKSSHLPNRTRSDSH